MAAVVFLIAGASTARAFTWAQPTLADQGRGQAIGSDQSLKLVSCPSAQLCVAIDAAGSVFASAQGRFLI
jgi:hypothetical protein